MSDDNLQMAKAAKENFLKVLEQDPKNEVALASMASLNYQEVSGIRDPDQRMAKLDEARQWYQKLAEVNPKNKEAFYSLGVIAWAKWYPAIGTARANTGMRPEDPGPLKDKKVREQLRAKWSPTVAEGIKGLEKALDIDPNYDDAMAYLNLLHRERADLADTPEEYRKDIDTADMWLQKALDTRKQKAGGVPAAEPAK
jgi:tetratricopeptide (TPR) repeat protein